MNSEDGQINYDTKVNDKKEPYEFTVGMGLVMRGYDTGKSLLNIIRNFMKHKIKKILNFIKDCLTCV